MDSSACNRLIDLSKPVEVCCCSAKTEFEACLSVRCCSTKTASETCSKSSDSNMSPAHPCSCRRCSSSKATAACSSSYKSSNNYCRPATDVSKCFHFWDVAMALGQSVLNHGDQYRFCLELQNLTRQGVDLICCSHSNRHCRLGRIINSLHDRITTQIELLRKTFGCTLDVVCMDDIPPTPSQDKVDPNPFVMKEGAKIRTTATVSGFPDLTEEKTAERCVHCRRAQTVSKHPDDKTLSSDRVSIHSKPVDSKTNPTSDSGTPDSGLHISLMTRNESDSLSVITAGENMSQRSPIYNLPPECQLHSLPLNLSTCLESSRCNHSVHSLLNENDSLRELQNSSACHILQNALPDMSRQIPSSISQQSPTESLQQLLQSSNDSLPLQSPNHKMLIQSPNGSHSPRNTSHNLQRAQSPHDSKLLEIPMDNLSQQRARLGHHLPRCGPNHSPPILIPSNCQQLFSSQRLSVQISSHSQSPQSPTGSQSLQGTIDSYSLQNPIESQSLQSPIASMSLQSPMVDGQSLQSPIGSRSLQKSVIDRELLQSQIIDSQSLQSPTIDSQSLQNAPQNLSSLIPSHRTLPQSLRNTTSSSYPQLEERNIKTASDDIAEKFGCDDTAAPVPPIRTRRARGFTKTQPNGVRTNSQENDQMNSMSLTERKGSEIGQTATVAVQLRFKTEPIVNLADQKEMSEMAKRRHCKYGDTWLADSGFITESRCCDGFDASSATANVELRNTHICEDLMLAFANKKYCNSDNDDRFGHASSSGDGPFLQITDSLLPSSVTSNSSRSLSDQAMVPVGGNVQYRQPIIYGSKTPSINNDIRTSRSSEDLPTVACGGAFQSCSASLCRKSISHDAQLPAGANVEIRKRRGKVQENNVTTDTRRSRSSQDLSATERREDDDNGGGHRRSRSLNAESDERTSSGGLRMQRRRQESSCTTQNTSGALSTSSSLTEDLVVYNVPCDRKSIMDAFLKSMDRAAAANPGASDAAAGRLCNFTITVHNSCGNVTKSSVIQNPGHVQVGDNNSMVAAEMAGEAHAPAEGHEQNEGQGKDAASGQSEDEEGGDPAFEVINDSDSVDNDEL